MKKFVYKSFCLNAHYRKTLNYSEKILNASKTARQNLIRRFSELKESGAKKKNISDLSDSGKLYLKDFQKAVLNDLNTPKALSVTWNLLKDKEINDSEKYSLLMDFDRVFGLKLNEESEKYRKVQDIPSEIKNLLDKRNKARENKNWKEADVLRDEIKKKGYVILDTKEGPKLEKI